MAQVSPQPPAAGVAALGEADVKPGVPPLGRVADLRLAGADEGKTELGMHEASVLIAFTPIKMS